MTLKVVSFLYLHIVGTGERTRCAEVSSEMAQWPSHKINIDLPYGPFYFIGLPRRPFHSLTVRALISSMSEYALALGRALACVDHISELSRGYSHASALTYARSSMSALHECSYTRAPVCAVMFRMFILSRAWSLL